MPKGHFPERVVNNHVDFRCGTVRPFPEQVADTTAGLDGIEKVPRRGLQKGDGFEEIRFPGAVRADEDIQRLQLKFGSVRPEGEQIPQLY